ncbi:hypothetical protein Q3G72_026613 [Acer saccharum]|nr:hypothetical protein Q3G72_026613 [Acer saccharum]
MEYDVLIVGAGPTGLSAAIRFKQLCRENNVDLSVCVVEKGAEVLTSYPGMFLNPRALDELLPHWKQEESILYPVFLGGAIIGCSAGFLNVPKLKGTHTAMKSGMLAAEAAFGVFNEGLNMETYWDTLQNSWVWEELHKARTYRPAFEYGLVLISFLPHSYILKGRAPFTLKHSKPDHEATEVWTLPFSLVSSITLIFANRRYSQGKGTW